jgi:cellulose synthase/poly-beta-1,6-N-acetylglucosamine synthase-like glycosyltransferase
MVAEIVFFASLALIAYTYFGYPLLAFALSRLRPRPVRRADVTPSVSVIIAAYNEERDIAAKLENTLALDYDRDLLEIVVASDCSSDGTDEIVRRFADRGVRLWRQPVRLGKTAAQNAAVRVASGEVLVFSDATTMYEPDAVRKIVRSFADPTVGGATGHVVYVDRADTAVGRGARSYWGYEQFLKHCESQFGSLVGVHGCLYAVRRSAYRDLAPDMSSDFVVASEIRLQGLRTVYDPEAISLEDTNVRGRDEFRTRVRIIEQTMSALARYRAVLDPFRYGLYAVQMISHKVLRYVVPICLVLAYVANAVLAARSGLYAVAFGLQSAFYLAAAAGSAAERAGLKLGPLGMPYYFALANGASLVALVKFARGENHVVWEPIRGIDLSPTDTDRT